MVRRIRRLRLSREGQYLGQPLVIEIVPGATVWTLSEHTEPQREQSDRWASLQGGLLAGCRHSTDPDGLYRS